CNANWLHAGDYNRGLMGCQYSFYYPVRIDNTEELLNCSVKGWQTRIFLPSPVSSATAWRHGLPPAGRFDRACAASRSARLRAINPATRHPDRHASHARSKDAWLRD